MRRETILHLTSSLPHESALAALPDPNVSFRETGFGGRVGGTAPAVGNEATTNASSAARLISDISPHSLDVQTLLDTPFPYPDFSSRDFPFALVTYPIPCDSDGNPLQVWDMHTAYLDDPAWRLMHQKARTKPGRHIVFAHHTLGMALEHHFMHEEVYGNDRTNHLVIARAHSQLLATTKYAKPDYYAQRYEGQEGTEYFWNTQRDALQSADLFLFPTDLERDLSIHAVVSEKIIGEGEMRGKSLTVGIPLNLDTFTPDLDGSKRKKQIDAFNTLIAQLKLQNQRDSFFPSTPLSVSDTFFAYIGRLDFEKRPWELAEAYASYLRDTWKLDSSFARLLIIGGLTNKPGALERHREMLSLLRSLPPHLQEYFIIPALALPHEDIVHIAAMQVYPSVEEGFNIGEKQARAAGILVGLSEVAGHLGTNRKDVPGCPDTALWLVPTDDWTSYATVFEAARNPHDYHDITAAGYDHVKQFSAGAVMRLVYYQVNRKFPGFLQPD